MHNRDIVQDKAVYLTITTWIGTAAIGASHWYGKLGTADSYSKFQYLYRAHTAKSAARANKLSGETDPLYKTKPGDMTEAFDSKAELIANALNCWQKHYPDREILLEGDHWVAEPTEVLAHPDVAVMERANALWAYYEGMYDDNKSPTSDELNAVSDEWYQLLADSLNQP